MDVTSAMPSVDADAVRRGEVVDDRATIVDLCSGFGYLGMFLSEMLDPSKVKAIELVDKQWPMWTAARPTASQINWDHIRGVEGVRASELGGDRRRDVDDVLLARRHRVCPRLTRRTAAMRKVHRSVERGHDQILKPRGG